MSRREWTPERKARANRPWRRWLRRHTWFLSARRREVHRLQKQVARRGARRGDALTTTHTRTHVFVEPANPYLTCDQCGEFVTGLHNPKVCGCDAAPWAMPCRHLAMVHSVCPSWSPVEVERLRTEARTLAHTLKLAAAERDALGAATQGALKIYAAHWKTEHIRPNPDCDTCRMGLTLARDTTGESDDHV